MKKKFTFEDYREALIGVGRKPERTSWSERFRTRTLSSRISFACARWPTRSRRKRGVLWTPRKH